MNINNAVISGRLTADVELKPAGKTSIARFTVAVDKGLSKEQKLEFESQNKPTADFINIQAWGALGEFAANYTGKGLRVIVEGRITTGSYTNKEGRKVSTVELTAKNIEPLDWKSDNSRTRESKSNDLLNELEYNEEFAAGSDKRIPF